MRVAIPVTAGKIPNHLGHCESFLIADVDKGAIVRSETVPNPGHGPGGPPPVFIARKSVNQVLAWGIPPAAVEIFKELGMGVELGVTGEPKAALEAWLSGKLVKTKDGLDAGGGCGPSARDGGAGGGCGGGH